MKFNYCINDVIYDVELVPQEGGYVIKIGEKEYRVENVHMQAGHVEFRLDGERRKVDYASESNRKTWLSVNGQTLMVEKPSSARRRQIAGGDGGSMLVAPMPGQVREVLAAVGDKVEQGQTLVLLEAMKMEIRIKAPRAGVVKTMSTEEGGSVDKGAVLVELEKLE